MVLCNHIPVHEGDTGVEEEAQKLLLVLPVPGPLGLPFPSPTGSPALTIRLFSQLYPPIVADVALTNYNGT